MYEKIKVLRVAVLGMSIASYIASNEAMHVPLHDMYSQKCGVLCVLPL